MFQLLTALFIFIFFNSGMRFGLMQNKIGIASILSKFNVEIASRTKEPLTCSKSTLLLNCENGIWIQFDKRKDV